MASFAYDALNRLSTAEERDGKRYAYAYDASGNRTSTTVRDRASNAVVKTESYSYDARNRVDMYMDASGMPRSFNYDANGNVIEDQNGGYVYDAFNRLTTHVEFQSGQYKETHYAYNGDGQRVSKTDAGNVSTYYQYDSDKVVLEQKSTGEVTRNTYGLNLISRSTGKVQEKSLNATMSVKVSYNETLYYQYNGHADVTRLSDANGIEKASYTYDAFGNVLESTGTENNPYRYAGYTYDEESSLYYLNARYYSPKTARFQATDPHWNSENMIYGDNNTGEPNAEAIIQSSNLYVYCGNDPAGCTDPSGEKLIISGEYNQPKEVLVILQQLTNDKLTVDGNAVTIKTKEASPTKKTGTELIRRIISNVQKTCTIFLKTKVKNGAEASSLDHSQELDGVPSKGSSTTVYFNPIEDYGQSEMKDALVRIMLGHELIHAERQMAGVAIDPKILAQDQNSLFAPKEELITVGLLQQNQSRRRMVITENTLRRENGEADRTKYSYPQPKENASTKKYTNTFAMQQFENSFLFKKSANNSSKKYAITTHNTIKWELVGDEETEDEEEIETEDKINFQAQDDVRVITHKRPCRRKNCPYCENGLVHR